jgi:electron transport complex protein RnfD
MRFKISPAPHAAAVVSVPQVMRRVLYALVPAAVVYVWFFGFGFVFNFAIAAAFALLTEAGILHLRGRSPQRALHDCSALVTAALLTFALPPLVPWWIPAIGSAVAIAIGKQLYGGLGRNLFNPAMVGYVFLLVSFPVEMTQWIPPRMGDLDYRHFGLLEQASFVFTGSLPAGLDVDALTRATPLDLVKEGLRAGRQFAEIRGGSLFGDFGGRGWEWIANLIALGGLYLLYTGTIRWHIPVATFAGLLVPATILHLVDPAGYVATDPVSAASTQRGRLIFGAGIGLLTYAIRTWGGYPDGMAFAVLLMNAAVPLIDRYTRPRIYGK